MTTATAPIHDVVQAARVADAALAASDLAAVEAARLATAKPTSRAALKAAADNAHKELEARRMIALERYALQTNEVHLATLAVADAHHAHADAVRAAHTARRSLEKMRNEIADLFGVAVAREEYNERITPENRARLIAASDAVNKAMADLPPTPPTFGMKFSSRMPGEAAYVRADQDAITGMVV